MQFLYKDDNRLIFDMGYVEVPNEDPSIDEFLSNKYKEFLFHVETKNLRANIYFKRKLLSKNFIAKDILIYDGYRSAYIDELTGKAAEEFYKNIDYFVENPRQVVLLPFFPEVDYKAVEIRNLPYFLQGYTSEKFYFVANGLINGIVYEYKMLTVSSYTIVAQTSVSPGKFPDVLNTIFSSKTVEDLMKKVDMISIESDIGFTPDPSSLYKIILLPIVFALTLDEKDRYYFAVYHPQVKKIIRFYTNPKGASIWGVSTNEKEIQNIDMTYVTFYDYLTKIMDEHSTEAHAI